MSIIKIKMARMYHFLDPPTAKNIALVPKNPVAVAILGSLNLSFKESTRDFFPASSPFDVVAPPPFAIEPGIGGQTHSFLQTHLQAIGFKLLYIKFLL